MNKHKLLTRALGIALAAGLAVTNTGCDSFLEVENPNNLEAENIDPENDARLLGLSVWQAWIDDVSEMSVQVAWYTASAWVGDTFPTRNDYGRRDIPNTTDDGNNWSDMGDNIYFARKTIEGIEAAGNSLDLARAWFVSGETIRLMAETFCVGTIADHSVSPAEARGPMTTVELLDSAIADLTKAKTVAQGVTGADAGSRRGTRHGSSGPHRPGPPPGRPQERGFGRSGSVWQPTSTSSSGTWTIPATGRWATTCGASRRPGSPWLPHRCSVPWPMPVTPASRTWTWDGWPRTASSSSTGRTRSRAGEVRDRWASGLEARYIKVEADQNAAAMLAFINERRAYGNQTPFPATTNLGVLMTELLEQKTRDFWLESTQRMADFRRAPEYMSYIIPAGDVTYYKPELGVVRDRNCWPVTRNECDNNLNFKGTQWCSG